MPSGRGMAAIGSGGSSGSPGSGGGALPGQHVGGVLRDAPPTPQSVSKYEIVGMINDIYGLNNKIISHDTETMVNKTLLSKHNHCAMMDIPDLYTQITELQQYKDLC